MDRPNLFDLATSELSQDAFLRWLLSWADVRHRAADEALHTTAVTLTAELVRPHGIEPPAGCQSLEVRRQYKDIDILVLANDDLALLIEDKTDTGERSDQLRRYLDVIRHDFPGRQT
jgi:hypothetical protein